MSGIRVANAPCSYGAFEITVGVLPDVPGPERVLSAIADAGYEGTELGPPGYLGDARQPARRLEEHGLALVGGYIPIRFSEPEHWAEDLAAMSGTLDLFAAAEGDRARRPCSRDGGLAGARASPGPRRFGSVDRARRRGLARLSEGVARAADLARNRGFEPTFHHHTATFVEAPWEIERVLELTDVGLLARHGPPRSRWRRSDRGASRLG